MILTFCGHSNVRDVDHVREWLSDTLEQFLYNERVICYLGGYGGFDRLAASVVRQKQKTNPTLQAVLILPYLNKNYDESEYDDTLFPPLESVPPRYAISKRNEWMVAQADAVIAYVTHNWGGAAKTLKYARSTKKTVVVYPETSANGSGDPHPLG